VTPAPVAVTCWGELPAERPLPGVLRVLVGGQHAGAAERAGGTAVAHWSTAGSRDRRTEHASAEDAVTAVIRSGFARRLGARAASRVRWSDRALHAAHTPFRA